MLSTLIRRRNFQAQPKILKKINETPNLPIFPKNYVSYLKSVKEPKIRIGATRRNLQPKFATQNVKKIVGTSYEPIRTKISPKNYG
jgi:hypothetical protein